MDEFQYRVSKAQEGTYKLLKPILILSYIIIVSIYVLVIFAYKILPLGAFTPVIALALSYFTWGYANIDYLYDIKEGTISFKKIIGNKKKHIMLYSTRVKNIIALGRYSPSSEKDIAQYRPTNRLVVATSMNANDLYFLIVPDEKDSANNVVIFFNGLDKVLKAIKYYNSDLFAFITLPQNSNV